MSLIGHKTFLFVSFVCLAMENPEASACQNVQRVQRPQKLGSILKVVVEPSYVLKCNAL